MVSKKSKLLESSLHDELHPFAARTSVETKTAKELLAASSQSSPHSSMQAFGRSPSARRITRCSFELFQDQMDSLRELSLKEKINGEKGSMSQMAREAIDAY